MRSCCRGSGNAAAIAAAAPEFALLRRAESVLVQTVSTALSHLCASVCICGSNLPAADRARITFALTRAKIRGTSRVEERRGIAAATRFPSPLIKPDVRISRIRLSDWLHDRLTTWRLSAADGAVSAYQGRRIPRPC